MTLLLLLLACGDDAAVLDGGRPIPGTDTGTRPRNDGGSIPARDSGPAYDAHVEVEGFPVGEWVEITPPEVVTGAPETCIGQGLALDPRTPGTIYWGTTPYEDARGGLFKSTDFGSTWRRVASVTPAWDGASDHLDMPLHVRIDPDDSNHLYAGDGVRGSSQGFFVSRDGGETFVKPRTGRRMGFGPLDQVPLRTFARHRRLAHVAPRHAGQRLLAHHERRRELDASQHDQHLSRRRHGLLHARGRTLRERRADDAQHGQRRELGARRPDRHVVRLRRRNAALHRAIVRREPAVPGHAGDRRHDLERLQRAALLRRPVRDGLRSEERPPLLVELVERHLGPPPALIDQCA
jgi:hypothetical protein